MMSDQALEDWKSDLILFVVDATVGLHPIDKEIVKKYKEDVIVLTGSLYGEVPSKLLNIGLSQAEEALLWWKEEFGDDLYIELMRHNQEDENRVNTTLIDFSKKHNIKLVAANNVFYINKEDNLETFIKIVAVNIVIIFLAVLFYIYKKILECYL